jgi:hypothetical protein
MEKFAHPAFLATAHFLVSALLGAWRLYVKVQKAVCILSVLLGNPLMGYFSMAVDSVGDNRLVRSRASQGKDVQTEILEVLSG